MAKAPTPQPLRLEAPAAGKYSVTAVSLTARKAPRLRLLGAAPSDLVFALGVARDRKHAGRYVGFAALLRKAPARKTQAVAAREATFVVAVDPGGAEVAGRLRLREACCPSGSSSSASGFRR